MSENPIEHPKQAQLTRREFVGSATALTVLSAINGIAAEPAATSNELKKELSPAVQMQYMRPAQLEKAIREFPAVYVPFGLIEWHGRHLPLGNDAIKAHAILVKTAEQSGGVVYPPVYFHEGFPRQSLVPVLTELFQRLKKTGFRVLIGVSGHNVQGQIDMINAALQPVVAVSPGRFRGHGSSSPARQRARLWRRASRARKTRMRKALSERPRLAASWARQARFGVRAAE